MNFAFTEEQEQLREFVRQFMDSYSPEAKVRELMETESGYDPETWSLMADQLGLQSLIVPEEYGGQGFGYVELIVVLEEMGRSLLCAPFFSTVVLAAPPIPQSRLQHGDFCCGAPAASKIWKKLNCFSLI